MTVISDIKISVDLEETLKYQGMTDPARLHPLVVSGIKEVLGNLEGLLEPKAAYKVLNVKQIMSDRLVAENNEVFAGPDFIKLLPSAVKIAVGICTIGPGVEEQVAEYIDRHRSSQASILDCVGSIAANKLARGLIEEIMQYEKMPVSNVIRPGIGRAPLDEQRHIYRIVSAGEIGISINTSGILTPQKSISMLAGLSNNRTQEHPAEICENCNLKETCTLRSTMKTTCNPVR